MKKIKSDISRMLMAMLLSTCQITVHASGGGQPPPAQASAVDWLTLETASRVLGPVAIGIGVLLAVTTYLNSSIASEIRRRDLQKRNDQLQAQLDRSKPAVDESVAPTVQPPPDSHLIRVRNEFGIARENLHEHLLRVNKRANFNLGIGITISFGAIVLLLIQLLGPPPATTELPDIFIAYFPRVITCVFIEILAFFFLRLYRASLIETRAYEIELQELSTKKVAFEATWDQTNIEVPRVKIAMALVSKDVAKPSEDEQPIDPGAALDLIEKLLKIVSKKPKADD